MKTKEQEVIVMFDSPEAASIKTVTGWVSRTGRFFGKDERAARYEGCTHGNCSTCGKVVKRSRLICDECCEKKAGDKYAAMPFMAWDGKGMVYSNTFNKYFSDAGEIGDFIEEHNDENPDEKIKPEDLRLVTCDVNTLSQLDPNEWPGLEDMMPGEGDLDAEDVMGKELIAKIAELNEIVRNHKAISYMPGMYRTEYKQQ